MTHSKLKKLPNVLDAPQPGSSGYGHHPNVVTEEMINPSGDSQMQEEQFVETIKFGDIAVSEKDTGIEFKVSRGNAADIGTSEVPLLIDFLKQHLDDSANRRSSWRLPLTSIRGTEADDLSVTVFYGQSEQRVTAKDISLTGMFIEAFHPIGERGDTVDLEITFAGFHANLRGLIVRQDKAMTRCALQFHDCMDAQGVPCPPEPLSEIFYKLEQIWLDKQLTLEWR